jgi:hypothetical protein
VANGTQTMGRKLRFNIGRCPAAFCGGFTMSCGYIGGSCLGPASLLMRSVADILLRLGVPVTRQSQRKSMFSYRDS